MNRIQIPVAVLTALSPALAFTGGDVAAAPAPTSEQSVADTTVPPRPEQLFDEIIVIEEAFTLTGSAVSVSAVDGFGAPVPEPAWFERSDGEPAPAEFIEEVRLSEENGEGEIVALGSGAANAGSSSASGCKRATVTTTKRTALNNVAFRYATNTYWCWNRNDRTTSSTSTGWELQDVDGQFKWRGEVQTIQNHYEWSSGYKNSGYRHYRQGEIENCVLKWGCVNTYYPTNDLKVHSNGTYYYSWSV